MDFYWSLSNSNYLQVSRTFLSTLVDFNNALIRMVSILPLISKSSYLDSSLFGNVLSALITISNHHPHCSTAFSVLWQRPGICPSFHFLLFSLGDPSARQNPLNDKFLFFLFFFFFPFFFFFSFFFFLLFSFFFFLFFLFSFLLINWRSSKWD